MENGENNKKDDKDLVTIKVDKDGKVIKYSTLKRMMNALDRFLTKRFIIVIAFCSAIISVCAAGLVFANTGTSIASSGKLGSPGGNPMLRVWLWSIIIVFGFVAAVTAILVLRKKKTKPIENS